MPLPMPAPLPTAYETAYRLLNSDPGGVDIERRAAERQPFPFVQRIAAYDGQDDLAELRFFPVQCHDISRRGFAFFLPGNIDFSRLVVELGSDGRRMYFEAEKVNVRVLVDVHNGEFASQFAATEAIGSASQTLLIGCCFKARLELHPA